MAPNPAQKTTRRKQVTIYFPTHGWLLLPRAVAVALVLVVLANAFSLLKGEDWSAISIELHLLTDVILLALIGLSSAIAYSLLRILSPFCIVDSESLVLVRRGRAKEYLLGEIEAFLMANTASIGFDRPILKTDLYILDAKQEKKLVYSSSVANRLKKSWRNTAGKLADASGKKISIEYLVEDVDGSVYDLESYRAKQPRNDDLASLFEGMPEGFG